MDLHYVETNIPFSQAISSFNENDIILEGRIAQQEFNKYELDQLFDDLGLSRKYKRLISLGHTINTYDSWENLKEEAGYGIWKFPVSDFKDNELNNLYFDDKVLNYRGEASSESIIAFDSVLIYDGMCYTDITSEAESEGGEPFEILDGLSYYLYVGDDEKFSQITFELETMGANYDLLLEYYDGISWLTLTFEDETLQLTSSGRLVYTTPDGWSTTEINGEDLYWIRISTIKEPVVIAKAYSIWPPNSVISLLQLNSTQILEEEWAWCYYDGYIYVTIRNTGNPYYEGDYFIKDVSTDTQKQNYFVYNHEYFTDYEDSTYEASSLFLQNMKSGATQELAGASVSELWRTASHESLPDGVVMIGI